MFLPVHFYSHNDIFNTQYDCRKRFAILIESEEIVPELYDRCMKDEKTLRLFDGIFTHSERLLNKYENAHFIPGSSVWYGGSMGGGTLDETAFQKNKRNFACFV